MAQDNWTSKWDFAYANGLGIQNCYLNSKIKKDHRLSTYGKVYGLYFIFAFISACTSAFAAISAISTPLSYSLTAPSISSPSCSYEIFQLIVFLQQISSPLLLIYKGIPATRIFIQKLYFLKQIVVNRMVSHHDIHMLIPNFF